MFFIIKKKKRKNTNRINRINPFTYKLIEILFRDNTVTIKETIIHNHTKINPIQIAESDLNTLNMIGI